MWNLFSQYRAYSIRCLLALVVPLVHPVVVVAQAPLLTDATQESGIEAGVLDDWKRRAAETWRQRQSELKDGFQSKQNEQKYHDFHQ